MKPMPIIYPGAYKFRDEVNRLREGGLLAFMIAVPYNMLVPHEAQALAYHGRPLSYLAEVGISAQEACAILMDKSPMELPDRTNNAYWHRVLLNMVITWQAEQDTGSRRHPK